MATCADDFEEWLCTKLKALNTDQDVFSIYIRGILEGDEPNDDKLEALEGILFEIETDSMVTLSQEILDKWDMLSHVQNVNAPLKLDIDAQLASIMEKQAQSVVIERRLTDEERRYREAILAQYSHVSDNEDNDDDEAAAAPSKEMPATAAPAATTSVAAATPSSVPVHSHPSLAKNTNAEDVFKAEKEKRDKAKAESEKKKAADKANKEKQKQQQQERKEKEKKRTQKGERRR